MPATAFCSRGGNKKRLVASTRKKYATVCSRNRRNDFSFPSGQRDKDPARIIRVGCNSAVLDIPAVSSSAKRSKIHFTTDCEIRFLVGIGQHVSRFRRLPD